MMTGIVFSGMGLGYMIMPPLTSRLISIYDWRTAYFIIGIIVLVLAVSAAQFLRPAPHKTRQLSPENVSNGKRQISGGEGFSLREAIHTRQFWLLFALYFSFLFCLIGITVHIVIYATELGISATSAANILAIIGGVCIVGMNTLGSAADRIGNRLALAISFILMAVALFWLMVARELWALYLFAGIFGLGYGGMQVLFSPIAAELFGLSSHGVILSTAAIGGNIGAATGPVLAGYIFDTTSSYNPAFLTCATIAAIGFVLASLLKPFQSKGELR